MLTTGLLSLNIHEALTFETEICLHPDLFGDQSSAAGSSIACSGRHGVVVRGTASGISSTGSSATGATQGEKALRETITTTASDDKTSSAGASTSSQRRLEVGDMIEIRVWDPIPMSERNRSPLWSGFRKRISGQSSAASASASGTEQRSSGIIKNNASNNNSSDLREVTPTASIPNSTPINRKPSVGGESLQYSEATPLTTEAPGDADVTDPSHSLTNGESSTVSSGEGRKEDNVLTNIVHEVKQSPLITTKSVITAIGGGIPPVFPKSRTNTNEATSRLLLPKPPTSQRRPLVNNELYDNRKIWTPKPVHVRDISDMTAESALLATHANQSAEGAPPSLEVLGVDSIEEEEDDLLTKIGLTHNLRLSFVMLVTEKTLTSLKGSARTQVSLLRQVADLYDLSSYDMVSVNRIEKEDEHVVLNTVSADFVVVTIKDQFISRGDMHLFQKSFMGSWIYEGQRLHEATKGIKAHAYEIRHGNMCAKSGIITENTMITYRSRSARIFWLVQISAEMWDYTSPYQRGTGNQDESVCEIYFDKWISFVHRLFATWKQMEATHSLTVVFFSRTFLGSRNALGSLDCKDVYGRRFEDHYKVVLENETCTDWESLVIRIKEAFVSYPIEVGWNLSTSELGRRPSNASQGNVLEAINVTLNLLQFHYLDRDLHRTGNSIVVISPGCGVFEVDKGLAGITYQRMMDHGIGSDMLSLGLPPLHIAPFFLYNNDYRTVESRGVDTSETYYEVPHWMHLSFISYDNDGDDDRRSHFKDQAIPIGLSSPVINVAANGFLLHRPYSRSHLSPVYGSSGRATSASPSFSVIGNANASPEKVKLTRERQLIAGRDFQDILEACRPRSAGMLPSALKALLKAYRYVEKLDKAKAKADVENDDKDPVQTDELMPLREWGSVDFRHDHIHRLKRSNQRPASNLSSSVDPLSPRLKALDDKLELSDSPSSSYTSQFSSFQGMSFDRPFIGRPMGAPPIGGIQLQRCPSLELITLDAADSETVRSEESASTICADASIDGPVDDDLATSRRTRKDRDKYADDLRKIIKEHDSNYFSKMSAKAVSSEAGLCWPPPPGTDAIIVNQSSSLPPMRITRGNENNQLGGIGAALSQYAVSTDVSQAETPKIVNAALLSGSSHGFQSLSHFPDLAPRAMSPLLLPPSRLPEPAVAPRHDELKGNRLLPFDPRTMTTRDIHIPRTLAGFNSHVTGGNSARHVGAETVEIRNIGFREREGVTNPPVPRILSGVTAHGGSISINSHARVDSVDIGRFEKRGVESAMQLTATKGTPPRGSEPPRGRARKLERASHRSSGRDHSVGHRSGRDHSVGHRSGRDHSVGHRSGRDHSLGHRSVRDHSVGHRSSGRDHSVGHRSSSSRRKKVFNPFRQEDEDKVLKKRDHNRRRWSHVFHIGDIEFKRHAGPSWNSLSFPAILPLSVDYFPSPQEREHAYQWNIYNVTLSDFEETRYSTHTDLLIEMVRQRLVQDYQLVPHSCVADSIDRSTRVANARYRSRTPTRERGALTNSIPGGREANILNTNDGTIKHYLTMGHRLQILTYDPHAETIEVIRYDAKIAQNDAMNVHTYHYLVYCTETQKYSKVVQTFKKYADLYNWNKVDRIICGGVGIEDKSLREGMRSRRLTFALIPPERFKQPGTKAEQEYISNFKRLSEYLSKLSSKSRDNDESSSGLEIKIVSLSSPDEDKQLDLSEISIGQMTMGDSMRRSEVQLRKGKRETFEWIELGVDSFFDTTRTYRIMYNWLVASSGKVETQVQLLHRRCSQFGLNLVFFAEKGTSRNLFLNPFHAPPTFCIRDKEKAARLYDDLVEMDFVNDGILYSEIRPIQDCIENGNEYNFGRRRSSLSRQFVHRSGTLFVRIIRDNQGWGILVVIFNPQHYLRDNGLKQAAKRCFLDLQQYVSSLTCPAAVN